MDQFNKLFLNPVLFILIGCVAIALVWNVETKWIAIPVFVLAVLNIIYHLHVIGLLLDIKYRIEKQKEGERNLLSGVQKEPSSKRKQKLVYYCMLWVFIICTFGISISGKQVEQYLNWKNFILYLFLIGGFIAILCYRLFYHSIDPVFDDDDEKKNYVKVYAFAIPLLLCFHFMIWYNKLQPSEIIKKEQVIVHEKGENYLYGNKYLFLNINDKRTRFEIPKKDFKKIREKDTITIVVRKGALNFSFVDSFLVKPGS
jgi:glucan phosphoethanolaminetransferase (alkaline phosphatase superfamily)